MIVLPDLFSICGRGLVHPLLHVIVSTMADVAFLAPLRRMALQDWLQQRKMAIAVSGQRFGSLSGHGNYIMTSRQPSWRSNSESTSQNPTLPYSYFVLTASTLQYFNDVGGKLKGEGWLPFMTVLGPHCLEALPTQVSPSVTLSLLLCLQAPFK